MSLSSQFIETVIIMYFTIEYLVMHCIIVVCPNILVDVSYSLQHSPAPHLRYLRDSISFTTAVIRSLFILGVLIYN